MSAPLILDGRATADALLATLGGRVAAFAGQRERPPGLAVVIVGSDPASQVYVGSKARAAAALGLASFKHELPADTGEDELLALVDRLNADGRVDGILVQLPLPAHMDSGRVTQAIDPAKDVDGFTYGQAGRLAVGDPADALVPCTPQGAMLLLEQARGRDLSGLTALVIGRSAIVGKPMASLLTAADATVTIAHSRSPDLPGLCRAADIVVAAVGRPALVRGDWLKPGATVIDVGINRVPAPDRGEGKTRLVGDVHFASAREVAGAITPVPGGVGPMTIACLMANTLRAADLAGRGEPGCDRAAAPVGGPVPAR